jgi:hypothetical protein
MRQPENGRATRTWGRHGAVLASLLVAGQLAAGLHFLLVRHAICPFDGELVDVGAAVGHAHPRVHTQDDRDGRLPTLGAGEEPEAVHGHEHCVLAGHQRDKAVLRARVLELRAPPPAIVATISDELGGTAQRTAIHRLAPKQSPPAV